MFTFDTGNALLLKKYERNYTLRQNRGYSGGIIPLPYWLRRACTNDVFDDNEVSQKWMRLLRSCAGVTLSKGIRNAYTCRSYMNGSFLSHHFSSQPGLAQ